MTDAVVDAITFTVRRAWALERDRFDSELRDIRGRLLALEDYMRGAELLPLPEGGSLPSDLAAELEAINRRISALTESVAAILTDNAGHSVRVDPPEPA